MNAKMGAVLASLVLALSSQARGAELYCLATGTVNWNVSPPHMIVSTENEHGFAGWAEFWVETATGGFRERTVGSRALYTGGGAYTILANGSDYRQHWVGQIDHGGFESLRIDLTRDPMTFMRANRTGFVEVGTCVETEGRSFLDGREITE
jgi:hypothetical protein